MKIDYISDLHADFYVMINSNEEKFKEQTRQFADSLLPDVIGEVIVVAGDISHYNRQSKWILEYFAEIYKMVFFVLGNHDYYLVSGEQEKKYKRNSMNREMELVGMVAANPYIVFLHDFTLYDYKGVTFAGATNWYPLIEFKDANFFHTYSNDSRLIKDMEIRKLNYQQTEQYNKMSDVDVLITHVPPLIINSHRKFGNTSCYLNELKNIKAKHVISGHCHEQGVYQKGNVNFYINALGYPNECVKYIEFNNETKNFDKEWNSIKSFNV